MTLDQLAEDLNPQEVQMLTYLQGQKYLIDLQKKMEGQVPDQLDLISQYTELGYVTQTIEALPGMKCKFRTLPPFTLDESIAYAKRLSRDEPNNYPRILSRRRLSYGLISMNDKDLAPGSVVDIALTDLVIAGGDPKRTLTANADTRYKILEVIGLAEKIGEAFGVWETVIWNRINGIDDLGSIVKKSTGDTATEQSAP